MKYYSTGGKDVNLLTQCDTLDPISNRRQLVILVLVTPTVEEHDDDRDEAHHEGGQHETHLCGACLYWTSFDKVTMITEHTSHWPHFSGWENTFLKKFQAKR